MKISVKLAAAALLLSVSMAFLAFNSNTPSKKQQPVLQPQPVAAQKIQAAILLDVSNSMDGLIDQAKAQLWNMVSVMGKAKCGNNAPPQIEIALYEYGRSSNNAGTGYVKQISAFTSDLDKLSQDLFGLTTNGGDEYCGQVIYTSLNDLKWDPAPANYKVIFIAGNEDFLQGNLHYTKACALAKKNGVIVNTIYCGDRLSGIQEHWNLNAECGSGSFTNINQNEKIDDIPTPYDSSIFVLNGRLNNTYIGYGAMGKSKMKMQAETDQMNYSMNKSSAAKRAEVKGNAAVYKNDSWDLVDADKNGSVAFEKIDMKSLPDSLQTKTRNELRVIVDKKSKERAALQEEITTISAKRNIYLAEEKKKKATGGATLETAMEKTIKEQAKRYAMRID